MLVENDSIFGWGVLDGKKRRNRGSCPCAGRVNPAHLESFSAQRFLRAILVLRPDFWRSTVLLAPVIQVANQFEGQPSGLLHKKLPEWPVLTAIFHLRTTMHGREFRGGFVAACTSPNRHFLVPGRTLVRDNRTVSR